MYIRLLVTIPLAFYTSRIVLRELGVDDFGIYQAVAGIISLFAMLRSAFDSATQRYYNVALANNDTPLLCRMFSTSVVIHLVITVIIIALIEIFGLWFIANKMQYPAGREAEVYFVFHTMIVSVAFMIMIIPFSGMIIAKEHMKFYAYLSMADVILKLALVFLLICIPVNKLRIYAIFQMCVPIFLFVAGVAYFTHYFKEIRFNRFSKKLFSEMSQFSGWGLVGNMCYSLVHEGVNLLLNVFGGVTANTARGIAFQVRGVVVNVLTTTIMPVRPQATQLFIIGETEEFWSLIYSYSKILFLLASIIVIPILIFAKPVLIIWLGMEPEYSCTFLQLLMAYTLVRSLHEPIDIVFKASGRMKVYQLTTVCISSLTFFIGWLCLWLGFPIYSPFAVFIIVETSLTMALLLQTRQDGIKLNIYLRRVVKPCAIVLLIALLCGFILLNSISLWYISAAILVLVIALSAFFIGLTSHERKSITLKIRAKLHN